MQRIKELSAILGENVAMSKFKLDCLAMLILSLVSAGTTNLKVLSRECDTGTKLDSRYRRFQRFFASAQFDLDSLGAFLISLFFESNEQLYFALDRTNWKYGSKNLNILVLAAVYRGVAIPVRWIVLDKKGNSNTRERIELMSGFINMFNPKEIAGLLGDREFIGKEWFEYLQNAGIPFVMRIKDNTKVLNKGELVHVKSLFNDLDVGQKRVLRKTRNIWEIDVYLSAVRAPSGELVVLATLDKEIDAVTLYSHRWEIETLFSCLKGRGFDFEQTRITKLERISTMMAVLAIAFAWAHKTGEWMADNVRPITIKKHGRMAKSFFRYGIDVIAATLKTSRIHLGDWEILLSMLTHNQNKVAYKAHFSAF